MAPVVVRSSLEIMLDAIRQRDAQPNDLPPALPVRPTSKGRLPTSKRPLRANLKHEISSPRRLLNNPVKWGSKKDEQTLWSEKNVLLKTETFGSEVTLDVEKLVKSPCFTMLNRVSYEERMEVADDTNSPVVPLPPAHAPDDKIDFCGIINSVIEGTLYVQKNYRRFRAHTHYQQMKKGATALQSFIRAERAKCNFEVMIKRWRAAVLIQKHVRRRLARTVFNNLQRDIILLQSVVRGWLARKHFAELKKREVSKVSHIKMDRRSGRDPPEHTKGTDDKHPDSQLSVLAELQSQMHVTKAELREKEGENAILKLQLHEYETRWSEYELKMKSMEKSWQKQLASLQINFATARKNLVPEEMITHSGGMEAPKINHYYLTEDTKPVVQTPEGTLAKLSNASDMPVRNSDSAHNAVIQLMKEFDQRRKVFNDEAGLLVEVKSGQLSANMKSYEELRKLKSRFTSWKKDYKMRLREIKTTLIKLINPEKKAYKKWWCGASTR
ncbi:myosin-2-like [Canna indica]|uniref:Myosin-2-like n=1 Tax=Canna indica TaxID=4628 RepID=A0AAQ3QBX3_9LILI|nr:myosin-2-like [Canna indica]